MGARATALGIVVACTACGGAPPGPDADLAPDPAWPASAAIPLVRGVLGSFYTAPVTIGGAAFGMAIDTGSTTIGVAAASCDRCDDITPVYTPGASATADHATASATYADGSTWSGSVVTDDVGLGNGTPTERIALVAIDSGEGFFTDPSAQGILGLGPTDLLDDHTTSYADAAARTASGQLAFELCSETGTMWIGEPDPAAFRGAAIPTPLLAQTPGDPYDEVALLDLGIGDASLGFDARTLGHAVVDTGTTNFYVPSAVLDAIVAAVDAAPGTRALFAAGSLAGSSGTTCLVGGSVTSAQVDEALPALAVTFPIAGGDGTFTMHLPPTRSYLSETTAGTFCLTVGDHSGGPSVILGDAFLRGVVTTIDPRAHTVSFATDVGCPVSTRIAPLPPEHRTPR